MEQLPSRKINDTHLIRQDLERVGYSIVDVLEKPDAMKIYNDLMSDIEIVCPGWIRNNTQTWYTDNLLATNCGFVNYDNGLTHSDSLWSIRGNYHILTLFSNLYNCHRDNLIVSFDTVGLRYPPEILGSDFDNDAVPPHVDQRFENSFLEPYQAIYCITDSIDKDDGGLVVYPYSHKIHGLKLQQQLQTFPNRDFIVYPDMFFKLYPDINPIKLSLEMGQIVLWDSRLLHSSIPINSNRNKTIDIENPMLNSRMVAYICYADKRKCSQEILEKRTNAFNNGWVTNHMPLRPRIIETNSDLCIKPSNIKLSLVPIEEKSSSSCNIG